jgi:hypothetical protein
MSLHERVGRGLYVCRLEDEDIEDSTEVLADDPDEAAEIYAQRCDALYGGYQKRIVLVFLAGKSWRFLVTSEEKRVYRVTLHPKGVAS